MSFVPVILTAVSTVAGAYGTYAQGKVASAEYASQAAASNYNAAVNRQNAELAQSQAQREANILKVEGASAIARQRAALAQAGIAGSETAKGLLAGSEQALETDWLTVLAGGENEARGYLANANLQEGYAQSYKNSSKAASSAGRWGATTGLLSGSTGIYDRWNALNTRK
jgi:hypothetical protein